MYNVLMDKNLKSLTLSHHAYVLIGGAANGINEAHKGLLKILEKNHKISLHGNPDLFDRSYETFTIDDARELKAAHEMKSATTGAKKIFVLTMNGITIEAQNALLKLLEEPSDNAHFFIIIPSAHLILPTIKSRVSLIMPDSSNGERSVGTSATVTPSANEDAEQFLKLSIPKRLEMIKKFTEDISKEKKTNQDAIDLLNAVESIIYKSANGVTRDIKWQGNLKAIETAKTYLHDRAPSIKMLLEYVALNV